METADRSANSGADHAVMRELNRSLILELLKQQGPMSRAAIAKETQLAKPTVSTIVEELIRHDLAREVGMGRPTNEGGRPPILLEFNARSQHYVGIAIGVHRTTVSIADGRGAELLRREIATPAGSADDVLARAAAVANEALGAVETPLDTVTGIGVCVPGLVDLATGICLLAPNLGWRDVAVAAVMGAALGGRPVFVHNTAQAVAVAEAVEGAAAGVQNSVLLYVGTGVGAGLICEGRLFHGGSGIAGEVGHVPVPGGQERCSCGRTGCLETVASGEALSRAAAKAGLGQVHAAELVARAVDGDPRASSIVAGAGHQLGQVVAWLVNLLNPEVVVIGGGVADAGELLLGPIREEVARASLPQSAEQVRVVRWALGQDAKVRGAVHGAMHNAEPYFRVIFRS